eukprot:COSAG02_NODE_2321_length_9138_cov_11.428366_11_plen_50_part_00
MFSCLKVERDVLAQCSEQLNERPKLNDIANSVASLMGYDQRFGRALMAN